MSTESINHIKSPVLDHRRLTRYILYAMLAGIAVGLLWPWLPLPLSWSNFLLHNVLELGGSAFMRLLRMLVVPVVFFSLTVGTSSMDSMLGVGRLGLKSVLLYLLTTAMAVTLALSLAVFFHIGSNMHLPAKQSFQAGAAPSLREVLLQAIPTNPVQAMAQGHMLQIIVFAIFLGVALTALSQQVQQVKRAVQQFNQLFMHMIGMVMSLAPFGVFCLVAHVFARLGWGALLHLLGYFLLVLLVLGLQLSCVYSLLLLLLARINPWYFFKSMRAPLLFAFGVSSSSASIPLVLQTVQSRLGVANRVSSFVIPLGATINMDGTAIMQGVATVFIAHAYSVHLGLTGYLTVIVMATLASIGTAGVPGVGLITLAMVLEQVHLPVAGIAMILGVDRLLDMVRTAVNVAGDATVACVVARSEGALEKASY